MAKKLFFYFLAIWTISAGYSVFIADKKNDPIRYEDDPGVFEKILDKLDPTPGPKIKAKAAILIDFDSGEVLAGKKEDQVRPIASLTKLATAIVFLKTAPDLFRIETVTTDDRRRAGRTRLYMGEKLTLFDLLHLALVSSDNVAAKILARSTGFSGEEFVGKMNELAKELRLSHTSFVEPTGLDEGNVSTAAECAALFREALNYQLIAEAISKRNHTYKALNNDRRYVAYNTNRLLYVKENIIGGKTGYIRNSGYCLAVGVENGGRKLVAIVLGSPSNNYRYRDVSRLLAFAEE